ncbi:iron chelate uptake ABC transporter family permease subunit [Paenibacillus rhizovicinus]|uniref:Iron chelate uptake ABC transporter family permease subunit n=1 Tax=Paenibacillus rhizovicinus TaxID=2704463 RepID=A0A6C0P516_9BACL|nr:iron chelate uptake ABC transporter family permease subunit [Paenibacillus rhizovicinus]QHW33630.1 iron chelate uptake ABC transporter family permease subunit [Paenibacillus rhizovicinus]
MPPINYGRRYIRIRGLFNLRIDARSFTVTVILLGAAVALGIFGLMIGTMRLSVHEVFAALSGDAAKMTRTIVVDWRLPRVLAALVFGAGLAVSGSIFQSLTRNPLGSPDIIGFTSGSYTGALVAMLIVGSTSFIGIAAGALIGGLATAVLIYLLAFRKGTHGFRLIIVGVAASTILSSVNSVLLLRSKAEVALTAAAWGVGSLNGINWTELLPAMLIVIVLLFAAAVMGRPLRALELGEDAAKAHGIRVERSRIALIAIAVVLTAAPTAVMGPVSFVALAAPQIAIRFTKSAQSFAPVAAMGAFLLLGADIAAQRVVPGTILPVGVVTLSLGGLYLIAVLFKQARSGL